MRKFLLVDDTMTVLKEEKMMLSGEPCALDTASTSVEVLERAVSFSSDVILLDIVMPERGRERGGTPT